MEKDGHFLQSDPRWKGKRWHYPALTNTLGELTQALQWWERHDGKRRGTVLTALRRFNREVRQTITLPPRPQPGNIGSLNQAGCQLVSFCNVLRHLGARIRGKQPTPPVLLNELQDAGLLTVTLFIAYPGFEPLTILSKGQVRLTRMEDFGRGGVLPRESRILRELRRGQAAVVNVDSHEYFSASNRTHYVTLTRRVRGDWIMEDPAEEKESALLACYRRVYAVWLYQRFTSNK